MKVKFQATIQKGQLQYQDPEAYLIWLGQFKDGDAVEFSASKKSDRRTLTQNGALHLFFTRVAQSMEDAGYDAKKALSYFNVDIPMNATLVKEGIWKPIQVAVLGKSHTSDLNKLDEITKVWEVFNRFLAKMKIESIPFPSQESQFNKINNEK